MAEVFVLANVLDLVFTWILVQEFGFEGNPIMSFIIEEGFLTAFLLKLFIPFFIALILCRQHRLASSIIFATVTVLICIWNGYLYFIIL